jgi:hypothetical protein
MKWRSIVLPDWKKPAANGPWYQVESKPVMPVPRRSFTPLRKWPIAMPAITREMTVAIRDGRAPAAGAVAPADGTKRQRTRPSAATHSRYGTGLKSEMVPRSSATQISSAIATTALARKPASPPTSGSHRRRTRAAPIQAKPTSRRSSMAPSRYRPGPSIVG